MEEDYAESGQKTMSVGGTRGIYGITVVGPREKGVSRGLVPRASISKENMCVALHHSVSRESDDGGLLGERDHGTLLWVLEEEDAMDWPRRAERKELLSLSRLQSESPSRGFTRSPFSSCLLQC